jgi:hypothetical protein
LQGLFQGVIYSDREKAINEMQKNIGSLLVACPIQIIINVAVCFEGKRVLKTKKPFLVPMTSLGCREREILSVI